MNSPSGFTGVAAKLRVNCFYLADPSSQFVNNQLWFQASGNTWIESGITTGLNAYTGDVYTTPQFFYASIYAGNDYKEFNYGATGYNSYRKMTIGKVSSTSSYVRIYVDDVLVQNIPVAWNGPARILTAGNEMLPGSVQTYGSVSEMQWADLSTNYHAGWVTSSAAAYLGNISPAYIAWSSRNNSFRSGIGSTC